MIIQKLMLNEDGTYYAVLKTNTVDGYSVRIDIPSCTFDNAANYNDLLVKSIEEQHLFEMVINE